MSLNLRENVPLAPLTSFQVGGSARYFTEVKSAPELSEALEYAAAHKYPAFILGGGSNVVFADKGFPGLVIHLVDGGISIKGNKVHAGAGVPLLDVVKAAKEAGLAGIERLAGIFGSFGGAVRGNAGAFGTEIGDVVTSVKTVHQASGMVKEYKQDECEFSYRSSMFKRYPEVIILSADLELEPGADKDELERIIEETIEKREAKHPQNAKCAGSFFMNPVVKDEKLKKEFERDNQTAPRGDRLPAGWLIDHVGLRGKQVGGAKISDQHPNYLLNTGNATAEDIVMLSSLVKQKVRQELGVQLREEVQYVGF